MSDHTGERSDLARLGRAIGIYAATFLAGGAIAFAYSYLPLHSAKDWKIDYLDDRLRVQTQQLSDARNELEKLREDSANKPDTETFKVLQDELANTDKTISELERKLSRAEKRVSELEGSRKHWRNLAKAAESKAARQEAEALAASTPEPDPEPVDTAPAVPSAEAKAPSPASPQLP